MAKLSFLRIILFAFSFQFCYKLTEFKLSRNYFEEILESLNASIYLKKGQEWLLSQRDSDWGWGTDTDTANAIMALQLSGSSWINNSLEFALSVKQLEIHFLSDIIAELNSTCRNAEPDNPISPGRLAQFIDALLSVNKNPRDFYGYDLVSWLMTKTPRYNFEISYCALALCNAGVRLTNEQVKQMEMIMKKDTGYIPDTKAITLMALTCAVNQHILKHADLEQYIKQLSLTQKKDGSFGNIWSSGIVIQALLPHPYQEYGWNAKTAVEDLLSLQDTDGSFANQLGAFFVLPVLAGQNLLNINKSINGTNEERMMGRTHRRISIIYSIWINSPITTKYSITMQITNGTSMLIVMEMAAAADKRFTFKSVASSSGHFITSIGGIDQNPNNNTFWIYGLVSPDNPKDIIENEKAVDYFILHENGQHVVFWYKQLDL